MQDARFLLDASPWFIVVSLLVGAAYALWMYWKPGPWPKGVHRLLTGLRFLAVSLLCFLLLGPLVRQIRNDYEAPTVVIALDNSSSLAQVSDSVALQAVANQLAELGESLEGDFRIEYRTFDTESEEAIVRGVRYDHPETPLADLITDVKADYEGRNLSALVLASDGIYNQGRSPAYEALAFPVYMLGLGDTLPKKDLNLQAVFYNKIAYQGNRFPLVAEVASEGYGNISTQIEVRQRGRVIAREMVAFDQSPQVKEVQFLLSAEEQGLQRYEVVVVPVADEFTTQNNRRGVYLDVVEGREKVLIAAAAPHPDVKAIRASLEKNANYEVKVFIPGLTDYEAEKYDVVILHQLPSVRHSLPGPVRGLIEDGASTWLIWGKQTNILQFNQVSTVLEMAASGNQTDQVTPIFEPNFSRFRYPDEYQGVANRYPPVTVPFGRVNMKTAAEVLFRQRVGNIETSKPLWVLSTGEAQKQAVTLGEGLWQWRLQEYNRQGSQQAFDELVSKTVQYLSTREDKRKFKVYPLANEYNENEPVILETEVYNDIYEEVYGQPITLSVTDEDGASTEYTYTTSAANTRYRLGGLQEGIYQYTATTSIDGEILYSTGAFTIRNRQLESLSLTANHALLRTVAEQSGGLYTTNPAEIEEALQAQPAQALIHTSEEYLPLVNMPWVFFLVLLLLSVEWVMRRYFGSY